VRGRTRSYRLIVTVVVLVIFGAVTSLLTRVAAAQPFRLLLEKLALSQAADSQSPQTPLVEVGGPTTLGGIQLYDMSARYEKTDILIRNSTGTFTFRRIFSTWPSYGTSAPGFLIYQPQWRNNLTAAAAYLSGVDDGFHALARHPDYSVIDPENNSNAVLTYFSRVIVDGGPFPTTGFQIPIDGANSDKLYVQANPTSGAISELILFTPTHHYIFAEEAEVNAFELTRIEETQYNATGGVTIANISYSDPGVISKVTTVDGTVLIFNNSSQGVLQSISIDGGTIVSYSYNDAGLLAQVNYPETGEGETYTYGSTSFAVTTSTQRQIVTYQLFDAGPGFPLSTITSQKTEETTLSAVVGSSGSECFESSPIGAQTCTQNTISDIQAPTGDGTASLVTFTTDYNLITPYAPQGFNPSGTGPQTSSIAWNCSPACLALRSSPGSAWWFSEGDSTVYPAIATPVAPVALSSVDENSSFTAYPGAGQTTSSSVPKDAGFPLPVEYPTIVSGATTDAGTPGPATTTQTRTYVYGGVGQAVQGYEQMVASVTQASPLGGNATTCYNWDTSKNRLNSVVRSGTTVTSAPGFSRIQQNIGTIYSYDALGRITEVQGPCFVSSCSLPPTGTCSSSLAPTVLYSYYPSAASNGFSANRVSQRTTCTGPVVGSTCPGLATTYGSYDSRGHVTSSTDSNGVNTQLTYAGEHLVSQTVSLPGVGGASDTTTYGYDGDQLLWVQHPSGMVDVTCHRSGTSDPSCATGGTPSKYVQWKARCTSPACTVVTEKVVYQYRHGFVSVESYQDALTNVRRVVRHDRDPRGRPTFDALGPVTIDPMPGTWGAFDNQGNQVARGVPYNSPSQFCMGTGTIPGTDNATCALMNYDSLDRLKQLAEPTNNGTASSTSVVNYDEMGHIASLLYGCDGSYSNCQQVTYTYDDFGNLLTLSAPWLTGVIRYAYDPQGHIVGKNTPSMASSEYLQYDYDMLGRPLDLKHFPVNETLWALDYDTTNTGCSSLVGALTAGRVQVRHDSFGATWYVYNFRGQVTAEMRVRAGGSCEALPAFSSTTQSCQGSSDEVHLNTLYSYSLPGGILSAMQYPHGRVVRFGYPVNGTGDVEQPSSISADLLKPGSPNPVCTTTLLISNIAWEPYSGVSGYQVNSPTASSTVAAVEYLLNDNSANSTFITNCSGLSRPLGSNATGLLRDLWVSSGPYSYARPTGTGNIFARQYAWTGDQLNSTATCLLSTNDTAIAIENFGYDARLELIHYGRYLQGAEVPFPERDYTYDRAGNRLTEISDCWTWSNGYGGGVSLANRSITATCSTTCPLNSVSPPQGSPFLSTNYLYDSEGRLLTLTSAANSTGVPAIDLGFISSIDAQFAAVNSVYQAIQVNGSTWEYYYDADGRRRLKAYPYNSLADEYFYNLSSALLEDHEGTTLSATGVVQTPTAPTTLDEYVWIGNRPLLLIRGSLGSSGVRNMDFSGTCADLGTCGIYFPITDYIGKPVLLLDSALKVAGAADYDPFGVVNRVAAGGDTAHPYAAAPLPVVLAGFHQSVPPNASYSIIARARLAMVDTDTNAYASLTDLSVKTLSAYPSGSGLVPTIGGTSGATSTAWAIVPAGGLYPGYFQVRFTAPNASTNSPQRSGIAVAGYEYRKFDPGSSPAWLPLRFPGQYYDAETDLVQNRNRFYDASVGRYLAPDPIWQNAGFIVGQIGTGRSVPIYGYARNNPSSEIDSNGLCPAPAGAGESICIAFFIQAPTALRSRGDGRDFSSDSDPTKSRIWIQYYPESDTKLIHTNESCTTGGVCIPPLETNKISVAKDATGAITILVDAKNSTESLGPAIDAKITLISDNAGGWISKIERDSFPSLEGYIYQDGVAKGTLFQMSEVSGFFGPFYLFPVFPKQYLETFWGPWLDPSASGGASGPILVDPSPK
jgi:RHS repeat-associated protein